MVKSVYKIKHTNVEIIMPINSIDREPKEYKEPDSFLSSHSTCSSD